ncbi:MAG: TIGR04076 family protein [Proteobacteria bacterium]|nr:TIGR04076 family protein [Pseudomonadota bacterium]
MPFEIPKCKVTVIKRMANPDLAAEYLDDEIEFSLCTRFEDGQEIIIEHPFVMPDNFCAWAWADIRKDILAVATGSSQLGLKQRGVMISGCTDWFRPVIFKIEKVE